MKLRKDIKDKTVSLIPETEEDRNTLMGLLEFHNASHSLVPKGFHYSLPDEASLPITSGLLKFPEEVVYQVTKRDY